MSGSLNEDLLEDENKEQPKVVIIVLTYNSVSKLGDFLEKVIESLLKQRYSNLKILFVDNGSKDDTVFF